MELCSVCSWRWNMPQKCIRYFYSLWWASCRIWTREVEFLVPTTGPTRRRLFSTKVENVHSRFGAWNKRNGTKIGIQGIINQSHYNTATTNSSSDLSHPDLSTHLKAIKKWQIGYVKVKASLPLKDKPLSFWFGIFNKVFL